MKLSRYELEHLAEWHREEQYRHARNDDYLDADCCKRRIAEISGYLSAHAGADFTPQRSPEAMSIYGKRIGDFTLTVSEPSPRWITIEHDSGPKMPKMTFNADELSDLGYALTCAARECFGTTVNATNARPKP